MEGVRLFTAPELFNTDPNQQLAILEPTKQRTAECQETLTIDASKAVEIQLKSTLEVF